MRLCGVDQFIFSSTAAVYGNPHEVPMTESHPQLPINPYGQSKLAVENALANFGLAYGLRYTTFRYFNAAGAHPDGSLGGHQIDHADPICAGAAIHETTCSG